MKLSIDVNIERIEELVAIATVDKITDSRDVRNGARDGIDKAIQKYIYSQKENIIEKVIERASVEIVRKGLPKLLESLARKSEE
jgi:hypothetical protein